MGVRKISVFQRIAFIGAVFLFVIMGFALAFTVITPSVINTNQSLATIYNVTINVTTTNSAFNITNVTVTIPSGFTFTQYSNGTSAAATATFSNTSSLLHWNNTLGLVFNVTRQHFSFNLTANATTIGYYNVTINIYNSTGSFTNQTNITVRVNDTQMPEVQSANISSPLTGTNYSGLLLLNVTVRDNGPLDKVFFNITNSSGGWNGTFVASNTTGGVWNITFNTTAYADGIYNVTVFANDTGNNLNNSARSQSVIFDNTAPSVTLTNTVTTKTALTFSVSGNDSLSSIQSGTCEVFSASSGSISGNEVTGLVCNTAYTIGGRCTDTAGNIGTTSGSFTTSACTSTSSGGSSTGSGGSTGTWTNTYSDDATDLSMHAGGVTRILSAHWRIRVKIASETHYVGITSLSTTGATVEVSSTPQTKTMTVGETSKFDANGDGFYDMKVTLVSIANSQANLKVEYLHEEVPSSGTTTQGTTTTSGSTNDVTPTSEAPSQGNVKKIGVIVLIVIIVAVAGYLLIRQKSKKKARRGY